MGVAVLDQGLLSAKIAEKSLKSTVKSQRKVGSKNHDKTAGAILQIRRHNPHVSGAFSALKSR